MKTREIASIIVAIVIGLTALTYVVYEHYQGREDTFIEEAAEEIIKAETGLDVDLTPGSKEDDDDGKENKSE